MQANLELRMRPMEEVAVQGNIPREREGRWTRFNRAVLKFVAFHNDGALRGVESPYRWVQ